MHTYAHAAGHVSLADAETFEVTGRSHYRAKDSTIMADEARLRADQSVELTGFARKNDGTIGASRRRVILFLDDVTIPAAVRDELVRLSGLIGTFEKEARR